MEAGKYTYVPTCTGCRSFHDGPVLLVLGQTTVSRQFPDWPHQDAKIIVVGKTSTDHFVIIFKQIQPENIKSKKNTLVVTVLVIAFKPWKIKKIQIHRTTLPHVIQTCIFILWSGWAPQVHLTCMITMSRTWCIRRWSCTIYENRQKKKKISRRHSIDHWPLLGVWGRRIFSPHLECAPMPRTKNSEGTLELELSRSPWQKGK